MKSMKNYPACKELNAHIDVSSRTRGLYFGPTLHLYPYFVYMSSEGSDQYFREKLSQFMRVWMGL